MIDWGNMGVWGAVLLVAVGFAGGYACRGWQEEAEREARKDDDSRDAVRHVHDHWRG